MSCLTPYNLLAQVEVYVSMPSLGAMWNTPSENLKQIGLQTWDTLIMSQKPLVDSQFPTNVTDTDLKKLKRFIIIIIIIIIIYISILSYGRSSAANDVNYYIKARLHVFPQTETIMIVYHQPKLRHGKMQRDAYNLRSYCTLPLRMSTVKLRDIISFLLGAENKYVAMNKGPMTSMVLCRFACG